MEHVNDDGTIDYTASGYAGHGPGVNNPGMQNVPGIGPLPQGDYTIAAMRNNRTGSGRVLRNSMRLEPDAGNEMYNRDGFLIHGDNNRHDRSASEGCIILGSDARKRIPESNDNCLRVVP